MVTDHDDDELLQQFITEASEHLASVEDDILEFERLGEHTDPGTVNRLFRAIHTVKGGAGFLNMSTITRLAHRLETVVGRVRDGRLIPTPDICDTLLRGIDNLKRIFEDISLESTFDISQDVEELDKIVDKSGENDRALSNHYEPTKSSECSRFWFNAASAQEGLSQSSGMYLFDCTLDFTNEYKRTGIDPEATITDLGLIGTILQSHFDIGSIDAWRKNNLSRLQYSFLLLTIIDDPEILTGGMNIFPLNINKLTKEIIDEEVKSQSKNQLNYPSVEHETTVEKDAEIRHEEPKKSENEHNPVSVKPDVKPAGSESPRDKISTDTTVRIPLALLDKAMNLASELVLVRNQNTQAIAAHDINHLTEIAQRLNVVTSEMQETIMRTRMQPVGEVLNKYNRIVRDLARRLGKEICLDIYGAEVELDKKIIESLGDPLLHIIRNSVDHGIELPQERVAAGKSEFGRIKIEALHQAGHVLIRIEDDGRGINPEKLKQKAIEKKFITSEQAAALTENEAFNLIFIPGFSTSEKISDISGRGVGMDVVRAGIEKLSGTINITSRAGEGTIMSINLPLTLAIVPALIVSVEQHRFAIPQISVVEIVWLYGVNAYQKIERVNDREVYWLRGKLLPLIRLSEVLRISKTYIDPSTGEKETDRRAQRGDRRKSGQEVPQEIMERRTGPVERRSSIENSFYIVVLRFGNDRFGLVIDTIVDTEEIVVKQLHDPLRESRAFAGTTVLGDGRIAIVLDIGSIAHIGNIRTGLSEMEQNMGSALSKVGDRHSVLIFDIGGQERFAIALFLITRVDHISASDIQVCGDREYISLRGDIIPVIRMENAIPGLKPDYQQELYAIIPRSRKPICILASHIQDALEVNSTIDTETIRKKGVIGSSLVGGSITMFIDVVELVEIIEPGWFASNHEERQQLALVVDDTAFYRSLIASFIKGMGVDVVLCSDGKNAIKELEKRMVDFIVSDLDMPGMDGYALARWVRERNQFANVPLIAVSAQTEQSTSFRAHSAGFDQFASKLNREKLVDTLGALCTRRMEEKS